LKTLRTNGRVRGGPLAPRTVRHAHRLLSKALKDAAKHEIVHRNVASQQKAPKAPDDEIIIVQDVPGLVTMLRGKRLYTQAVVALFTGMRLGEILALRRDCLARRAAMLPGSALTKKDTRPIVLYLRSFQDDSKIKLRARAANGRTLPERLLKIPFEEVVTDHLWGYGPVLAIGDPRTKSKRAPLGAARDYADDSTWQQKVIELIQEAALIVVIAGGTKGLAWEIDTIVKHGALWKLVVLLPPVGIRDLQSRWQELASHVSNTALPTQVDFARARAAIFPKGTAAIIAGEKETDWTYEAVLDQAALVITNEHEAALPTAHSSQSRSGTRRIHPVLGAVVSDLASMMGAVLLIAAWFFLTAIKEDRRPYASAGYQRDKFVEEVMEGCRRANPQLPAKRLTDYCGCFTDGMADVLTLGELREIESDRTQERAKSIASACSEKMLGK
jgi:hypothetical protein